MKFSRVVPLDYHPAPPVVGIMAETTQVAFKRALSLRQTGYTWVMEVHTVTLLLLQLLVLLLMRTHSTTTSAAADENTQYSY